MIKFSKILTQKFLQQKYNEKNTTQLKIAKEVGCSLRTIQHHMKKFDINGRFGKKKYNIIEDFLIIEYTKNRKTLSQIAQIIGCSYETIRRYLKKYNIPKRIDDKKCKQYYCIDCDKQLVDYRSKRCWTCASIMRWQNKEYRESQIRKLRKACTLKPNKPEKFLNELFNKLFPREYKYTGNAKIFIEGFNPDFINCNGQKKFIEYFGDYWHNKPEIKDRDKRRLIAYKKCGYKTLVIWEHELKNIEKLKDRILRFNKMNHDSMKLE